MKKSIYYAISLLMLAWMFEFGSTNDNAMYQSTPKALAVASDTVTLTGTLVPYISLTFSGSTTVNFGNMTPGTPKCGDTGTVTLVTTNAANGYTLAVSDSVAGANSAMLNEDATTYIPDMNSGTIATPVLWVTGTHIGLGTTMYTSSTSKEASWGTGTTMCDIAGNLYAGIPENATTGHTVTGFHAEPDMSSWGWRIDSANNQKTGIYTGNVLFTSAAALS